MPGMERKQLLSFAQYSYLFYSAWATVCKGGDVTAVALKHCKQAFGERPVCIYQEYLLACFPYEYWILLHRKPSGGTALTKLSHPHSNKYTGEVNERSMKKAGDTNGLRAALHKLRSTKPVQPDSLYCQVHGNVPMFYSAFQAEEKECY